MSEAVALAEACGGSLAAGLEACWMLVMLGVWTLPGTGFLIPKSPMQNCGGTSWTLS